MTASAPHIECSCTDTRNTVHVNDMNNLSSAMATR